MQQLRQKLFGNMLIAPGFSGSQLLKKAMAGDESPVMALLPKIYAFASSGYRFVTLFFAIAVIAVFIITHKIKTMVQHLKAILPLHAFLQLS